MLQSIYIRNYALIPELELTWNGGFTTVTGETGAGKSILLGALGLLLGQRADTRVLRSESEKCIVEAEFGIAELGLEGFFEANDLDYYANCNIRREIAPGGKSRAFVNDTPVTLDVLKALGDQLLDIHSQDDTQLLTDRRYQLAVIDAIAKNQKEKEAYAEVYTAWRKAEKELTALSESVLNPQGDVDYLGFLTEELAATDLDPERYANERAELDELEHAEEIRELLHLLATGYENEEGGLNQLLSRQRGNFQHLSGLGERFSEWSERFESSRLEIEDLFREVGAMARSFEADPARASGLRTRLDQIEALLFKHKVASLEELIRKRDELKQQLDQLLRAEQLLAAKKKEVTALLEGVRQAGSILSEKRKGALPNLKEDLGKRLKELLLPHASLEAVISPSEPGPNGLDQVELMFTANPGSAPQPLRKVASGGERSRVMLALKARMCESSALPTILFDEIDTGVSGETAVRIGQVMLEMGRKMQVIAITHLAQIAALGSTQLLVSKQVTNGTTVSAIQTLGEDQRVDEIARLLSGARTTDAAREQARELLASR